MLPGDGWLHTGDVGEIDEDGFLTVTDRKKDIIVTAGGKNVSPQNIENLLKGIPWVSQALVVGDRRPYLVALLTLDPDEVASSTAARTPRPSSQRPSRASTPTLPPSSRSAASRSSRATSRPRRTRSRRR